MTDPDFAKIEALRAILQQSSPILGGGSKHALEHYLDHDEYEMALEGLLIDLLASNHFPADFPWDQVLALGTEFRLDSEPMFDATAWLRFLAAMDAARRSSRA
jgi:hypothetical protein